MGIVCYRCGTWDGQRCSCKDGVTLFHGDCRVILPQLPQVDLVLTDPPYLTDSTAVPIRGGGVAKRFEETIAVGMPWGYSLDWISQCELLKPRQWVVFANYRMLGGLCSALTPQTVFVWRKPNAPQMTRPVPRLDCEFIIWSRTTGCCGRMGEFGSMVIDVPMPQAGCFASERILERETKASAHPCQKPIAIVSPFVDRLIASLVLDPFAGTGTTLLAAKQLGRRAIGIEIEERYVQIAASRLRQSVLEFKE